MTFNDFNEITLCFKKDSFHNNKNCQIFLSLLLGKIYGNEAFTRNFVFNFKGKAS